MISIEQLPYEKELTVVGDDAASYARMKDAITGRVRGGYCRAVIINRSTSWSLTGGLAPITAHVPVEVLHGLVAEVARSHRSPSDDAELKFQEGQYSSCL